MARKKSDNLLREAIADARQVKETALANAKLSLEEAFTPALTSMLAKKLRNEADDEDEEELDEINDAEVADGHGPGEGGEKDVEAIEKSTFNENKRSRRARKLNEEDDDEEVDEIRRPRRARKLHEEEEDDDLDEAADVQSDADKLKSSGIGDRTPDNSYGTSDPKDPDAAARQTAGATDQNKGQEVMGEDDDPSLDLDGDGDGDADDLNLDLGPEAGADAGAGAPPIQGGEEVEDEGYGDEVEDQDQDMDVEAVIRELEADIDADEPDDVTEDDMVPAVDTDDRQDLAPEDDEVTEGSAGTLQTDPVADGHGSDEGGESIDTAKVTDSTFKENKQPKALKKESKKAVKLQKEADGDEEDVDLEEVLREIEDEEEEEKNEAKVARLQAELKEYRTAVGFLRSKLNEVNLLNAKLLFTNRLFRDYSMDLRSKMRVVENFDRATTVREAKLVYATIAESFRGKGTVSRKVRGSITEGIASKTVGSTKPKQTQKDESIADDTPTVLREGVDLANRFQKLAGIKK